MNEAPDLDHIAHWHWVYRHDFGQSRVDEWLHIAAKWCKRAVS